MTPSTSRALQRWLRRPLAVTVVALLAALMVVACSSSTTPDVQDGSVTTTNQQDAVFAAQLIELNEQLVSIADILGAKTDDPKAAAKLAEVERIANERIILAKGWLKLWGRTAVEAPPAPGLLTEAQLDALIDSNGPALAKAIASVTQSQLDGTLEISKAEVAGGENSTAKQVAQQLTARTEAELAALALVTT